MFGYSLVSTQHLQVLENISDYHHQSGEDAEVELKELLTSCVILLFIIAFVQWAKVSIRCITWAIQTQFFKKNPRTCISVFLFGIPSVMTFIILKSITTLLAKTFLTWFKIIKEKFKQY
jgi:hypothetical protein